MLSLDLIKVRSYMCKFLVVALRYVHIQGEVSGKNITTLVNCRLDVLQVYIYFWRRRRAWFSHTLHTAAVW